jgi:hypothetical protein
LRPEREFNISGLISILPVVSDAAALACLNGLKPRPAQLRNGRFDSRVVVALILREHADPDERGQGLLRRRDHNTQTAITFPLPLAMTTLTVANNHPVMHEALHVFIRDARNIRQPL